MIEKKYYIIIYNIVDRGGEIACRRKVPYLTFATDLGEKRAIQYGQVLRSTFVLTLPKVHLF